MKKPPRKAPVVSLRGSFKHETITQLSLRELEAAQRMEWTVAKRAALLSERVKAALERGAALEDGPLYFDRKLEMVKSRKESAG